MRKIVSCLMLFLIFALCGCTPTKSKISCFVYDENDTFMTEMVDKIVALGGDYKFDKYAAQNSQSIQNHQIVTALQHKTDLLLVNLVDRSSSGTIIEKTNQSGLHTIFFNREPLAADMEQVKNAYYVGAEPRGTGELQGEMIYNEIGEDYTTSKYDRNNDGIMQTVVLMGEKSHQDAEMRSEGSLTELKKHYEVDVISTITANWSRKEAKSKFAQEYDKLTQNVEIILCDNDDMALGVIDVLEEKGVFKKSVDGYNQPYIVVGVDATEVGKLAIRSGLMLGTVLNDASKQSAAIMSLAHYILSGKDMTDFPYVFQKENYIYIEGKVIMLQDVR